MRSIRADEHGEHRYPAWGGVAPAGLAPACAGDDGGPV